MAGIRKHTDEIVANAHIGCTVVGICPLCGNNVAVGMTGESYFCANEGCDFFVWKATKGRPVISFDGMKTLL
ncbi:MAG: hypothetical protein IKX16_05775 [Clostridia bacterium]|nr:hypothetical protein [Clostridia bacterium]